MILKIKKKLLENIKINEDTAFSLMFKNTLTYSYRDNHKGLYKNIKLFLELDKKTYLDAIFEIEEYTFKKIWKQLGKFLIIKDIKNNLNFYNDNNKKQFDKLKNKFLKLKETKYNKSIKRNNKK